MAGEGSNMAEVKQWEDFTLNHSLVKFGTDLPEIISGAGHDEMYGVKLEPTINGYLSDLHAEHFECDIDKFLRANMDDLEKAKTQLSEALKWRKEYKPLEAKDEVFDASKFEGLGYVTTIKGVKATINDEDVATFNIYGAAAKDIKNTFGDTEKFVRWRVALMELTLAQLRPKLEEATIPVPPYGHGPDPYQAVQIHDYLSVSFFRQPVEIKNSSAKIIEVFQKYYPETVSYKYFVNIPLVMQWMMGAMKALISKDAIQKMTWLTYGNALHTYIGDDLPKEYGGNSASLQVKGLTPKYDDPKIDTKGDSSQSS